MSAWLPEIVTRVRAIGSGTDTGPPTERDVQRAVNPPSSCTTVERLQSRHRCTLIFIQGNPTVSYATICCYQVTVFTGDIIDRRDIHIKGAKRNRTAAPAARIPIVRHIDLNRCLLQNHWYSRHYASR